NRAGRYSLVGSLVVGCWARAVEIADSFRCSLRLGAQVLEQELLLSAEEAHLQPAENVVHDRLGKADVGIARPSAGLEARVRKLLAEKFQRHSMLQRDRDRQSKAVHEARNGRAFLRHLDEDLARFAVGIEANNDVALVASDVELVRHRHALLLQLVTDGSRRSV